MSKTYEKNQEPVFCTPKSDCSFGRQVEEDRTGSIVSLDPYVWLFLIKNFYGDLLYDAIHIFICLSKTLTGL